MIKITGKLWLLVLCLSLIVSIPLASANEKKTITNGNFYSTNNGNGNDSTAFKEKVQPVQKVYVCSNASCGYEYVGNAPPETCPQCGQPSTTFQEKVQPAQKVYVCSNASCGYEYVGNAPPETCPQCGQPSTTFQEKVQPAPITDPSYNNKRDTNVVISDNDENNKPKDSGYGIFHLILVAVPGLLVVLCISLIFYEMNNRLNKKLIATEGRLKKAEELLKKIAPSKSEGSTELNINRPKGNDLQLEERLFALENDVAILKDNFAKILKALKKTTEKYTEEQQPQESSQWHSSRRETTANNQRIYNEGTTRPDQLSNKGISTSSTSNKSGLISGANRGLGLSPEIQKIIVAFNKMMLDSTKLDEGSMDLWRLRNNFIKDYNVIAFKCVNSQERVNHQEVQPRFEICQASESTLWRIELSDGTFAILPGLREYESTVHLQGGMKELFKSDYKSGTYRKIEMVRPAIVKRDFSINEQGELRLSQ